MDCQNLKLAFLLSKLWMQFNIVITKELCTEI
jgi:hypothetical protein